MSMKRTCLFLLWYFLALLAGFGEADGNRLLAAFDFLAAPAFQGPRFSLCMTPSTSLEALLLYRLIASSWANSTRSNRAGRRPGPASPKYGIAPASARQRGQTSGTLEI